MFKNKTLSAHLAALLTILLWGTTFVATKRLLITLSPVEILFTRFLIAYFVLWLVYPHRLRFRHIGEELYFAIAGLCGITLYFLLENIALTYTMATNIGVIASTVPFFTAITNCLLTGSKWPGTRFTIGFITAMAGICLISLSNTADFAVNPMGDFLAFAAVAIWSIYAVLGKKISVMGYNTIQTTRRTFFYGLLFMIPALSYFGFRWTIPQLMTGEVLGNILFLSFGASALCFVTWNFAVKYLGSVRTSLYIYMIPVVTAICSALFLGEKITFNALCGIMLTIFGLLLSESKNIFAKVNKQACTQE